MLQGWGLGGGRATGTRPTGLGAPSNCCLRLSTSNAIYSALICAHGAATQSRWPAALDCTPATRGHPFVAAAAAPPLPPARPHGALRGRLRASIQDAYPDATRPCGRVTMKAPVQALLLLAVCCCAAQDGLEVSYEPAQTLASRCGRAGSRAARPPGRRRRPRAARCLGCDVGQPVNHSGSAAPTPAFGHPNLASQGARPAGATAAAPACVLPALLRRARPCGVVHAARLPRWDARGVGRAPESAQVSLRDARLVRDRCLPAPRHSIAPTPPAALHSCWQPCGPGRQAEPCTPGDLRQCCFLQARRRWCTPRSAPACGACFAA